MTIQLEEKSIEIGGKKYVLHVNMSVLDRLQEAHGGDINQLMQTSVNEAMAETMAAMLNDWSEDQGWEENWTVRKVKKYFSVAMMRDLDVIGMFFRAMSPVKKEDGKTAKAEKTEPENSGN